MSKSTANRIRIIGGHCRGRLLRFPPVPGLRPTPDRVRETAYQSEADLEKAFIKQLQLQAYEYLPITSETDLTANLRRQLEQLNKTTFSNAEWDRFFTTCIAGANDGIVEKTTRIQEDHVQVLKRDDGLWGRRG